MPWAALVIASILSAAPASDRIIGEKVESLKLRDHLGSWRSLDDYQDKKVVVLAFLGTECPLAKLYGVKLGELERAYRDKGVVFLGIDSNQQDSITEIQHYATKHQIEFPILKDTGNEVADKLSAVRTPEVFVLDASRTVRYWGRIDDQYGVGIARKSANTQELVDAIDAILAGREVAVAVTDAPGCHIGRVKQPSADGKVTYSKHVAPIFRKRCESCHRENEIAPFSLRSYDEVAGWAETIAEVVRDQRMPPWHADPAHGDFRNDCRLNDSEKETIYQWVAAGAPEGNPSDLPPPAVFTDGWQIPKPDMVITMPRSVHIPATGVMGYRHIAVDPGFTEDKWVVAAEARPGARSVVHHIIVFVKPPGDHEDSNQTAIERAGSRFLVATAPGARPMFLPPGTAKLIPAGSKIVFQMHYTPNGTPQVDQSSVALIFTDPKNVRKRVKTAFSGTFVFQIPPHDGNYSIIGQRAMVYDTLLLAFMPHMHLRGKSFKYTAVYPDGTKEILLDVPRYDFNWQNTYELAEPKLLPAGTVLESHAIFDNSPENPANPDPDKMVRFGEQTWEEMMIGFYEACPADQDLTKGGTADQSRTESFLDSLGGDGDPIGPKLRDLARQALVRSSEFHKFAFAARMLMPQIDRICLTTFEKDEMNVVYAESSSDVHTRFLGAGTRQAAFGFDLAKYAEKAEPVVNNSMDKVKGFDLKLLRKEFQSSTHIPFVWNGKRSVLSFWSRDPAAFPELAVDVVKMLAEEIAGQIPAPGAKASG